MSQTRTRTRKKAAPRISLAEDDAAAARESSSSGATVAAIYEDGVIKPLGEIDLPSGTTARLRISARFSARVVYADHLASANVFASATTAARHSATAPTHVASPVAPSVKNAPTPPVARSIAFPPTIALRPGAGAARLSAADFRLPSFELTRIRAAIGAISRKEIIIVTLIVLAAALLRFYQITHLPTGLHGDEAIAGLEARRILRDGYIGPYSPLALGQPSGPLYLTAFSALLFGETILAVRFVSALIGTLTIFALYLLLRRNVSRNVALLGALLLATMSWHIHFTRIGYPLATWPFFALLMTAALIEAIRRDNIWWWAIAGASVSSGIYIYNAHPLLLNICGLFSVLYLGIVRREVAWQRRALWLAAFAGAIIIVATPLMLYVINPANDYFSHFRLFSLFEQSQWKQLPDLTDKLNLLVDRYFNFWNQLTFHPKADGADGTGARDEVPLVQFIAFAFAAIGIILSIKKHRRNPLVLFALLVIALMPFASVITIDGLARRTFAIAPFIAIFAALGVNESVKAARAFGRSAHRAAFAIAALLLAILIGQNINDYFRRFATSDSQVFVFTQEFTDATRFMLTLPPDSHVYFYSARWSVNYETRQWLAPNVKAEDRAAEHGPASFEIDLAKGRPVFILLGDYMKQIDSLRSRYPGGQTITGGSQTAPSFIAYQL